MICPETALAAAGFWRFGFFDGKQHYAFPTTKEAANMAATAYISINIE
jgi:hypothetical protein